MFVGVDGRAALDEEGGAERTTLRCDGVEGQGGRCGLPYPPPRRRLLVRKSLIPEQSGVVTIRDGPRACPRVPLLSLKCSLMCSSSCQCQLDAPFFSSFQACLSLNL